MTYYTLTDIGSKEPSLLLKREGPPGFTFESYGRKRPEWRDAIDLYRLILDGDPRLDEVTAEEVEGIIEAWSKT